MWSARLRRWHRIAVWIGGAQLLVWIGTGFAFTWFDFAAVRGTNDRAPPPVLDWSKVQMRPSEAAGGAAHTVALRPLADRVAYVIDDARLVDASDGRPLEVDTVLAQQISRSAHVAHPAVLSVEEATPSDPDVGLPAWRVRLTDAKQTQVFISRRTGEIVGWRNNSWRHFDRLWSLHVLGYVSRDHPAHLAMRIVTGLALAIALTGLVLLSLRRRN